jgi:hypothetical protein
MKTTLCYPGLMLLTAFALGFADARTQVLDLVHFDEDDPTGVNYYDASYGTATDGSQLTLGGPGDKLIILTDQHQQGANSGLVEWTSAPGGAWLLFIARPNWVTRNVSSHSNLVIWLNGPAAIPAADLPRVGLESSPPDARSITVKLGDFLMTGLDADPGTWEKVLVPLTNFPPTGGFDPTQVKTVWFSQNTADAVKHTLWVDNIRFVAQEGGQPTGPPPTPPTGIVTRAGDRSVVLHWDRNPETNILGYFIYRSLSPVGPFDQPLNASLVPLTSYADTQAANARPLYYVIQAVDEAMQLGTNSVAVAATPRPFTSNLQFLEYVQQTAFDYFWYQANPANGLVRDRSQVGSPCSVAAVGFGLTGLGIAVDHGWISREAARQRCLRTLRTFWDTPQGTNNTGTIGYRGWFYHFLDMETATRFGTSELSSIDTALFLAGVLSAKQYFDGDHPDEVAIRDLVDQLFGRVDWLWMANSGDSLTMGWQPDQGFLNARWIGYNEAMVLYLMAFGAATNPLPANQWLAWTSGYKWATNYGLSFIEFPPLFGHQYSHCWVDFRHVTDAYTRQHGLTYFENSRRATLAQQAYAMDNPGRFTGYGSNVWGFTACDGPGVPPYYPYIARGAPPARYDDGTIAPTAVGASLPFAPEIALPTLRGFYDRYRVNLWTAYGFRDAFNLSANWWGPDVIGIDQGPILLMIENWLNQRVWQRFMKNAEIPRGLAAAGFVPVEFPAPQRLESGPTAGAFTLHWEAASRAIYQVEYSPDLFRWYASPTGYYPGTAGGGSLSWIDAGPPATDALPASQEARFYRVFTFTP